MFGLEGIGVVVDLQFVSCLPKSLIVRIVYTRPHMDPQ